QARSCSWRVVFAVRSNAAERHPERQNRIVRRRRGSGPCSRTCCERPSPEPSSETECCRLRGPWKKIWFWANDGKERIHDDGAFIWSAPVDSGLSNTGLGCNRFHAKRSEANFEGQVECGVQDQLVSEGVSRPSASTGSDRDRR